MELENTICIIAEGGCFFLTLLGILAHIVIAFYFWWRTGTVPMREKLHHEVQKILDARAERKKQQQHHDTSEDDEDINREDRNSKRQFLDDLQAFPSSSSRSPNSKSPPSPIRDARELWDL
jgi:hypothetical protein